MRFRYLADRLTRGLAIVLVVIMLLPLVSAHSAQTEPPSGDNKNLLKTIIVDNYYPYTFMNPDGLPDGLSVDLLRAVAKSMGLQVEIAMATWDDARRALAAGDIDLLPMMAYSEQRAKDFDFSAPHTTAHDAIFVKKGDTRIQLLDDLRGKHVIVMGKDAAHDFLLSTGISNPGNLVLTDSLPDALRQLALGKGDAALMPKLVGLLLLNNLGLSNLEALPVVVEGYRRAFSIAVKKGDKTLLGHLSEGLSIVEATGEYAKIHRKWFGLVEPAVMPFPAVMKYVLFAASFIVLIAIIIGLWSLSLRKQVALRTRTLAQEVEERKQAEAALRESEKNYRRIVETANEGFWAMDGDYRTTYVNHRMADMLGYTPDEMIGRPVDSFMFTTDIHDHTARMEVRQKGGGSVYERRFRCKNGGELWAIVSATALKNSEGLFSGSFAMFTDITDRKQIEDRLRTNEQNLQTLFNAINESVFLFDWNGKVLAANATFAARLGKRIEDCIGATIYDLIPPDVAAKRKVIVEKVFQTGQPQVLEDERQGRWLFHSIWPVLDTDGSVARLVGYAMDITERKRVEESLRDSEERHRKIIEASSDVFLLRNSEGIVIYANPAALKLLRANHPEDLIGKQYLDLVHPDDRTISAERVKKSMDKNLVSPAREHRILALDGQVVHVESIGGIVKHRGESQMFGVFRDITERKRAEEEKAKLEAQLQQTQKIEAIGTLAGGIAHDFNNILSVIIGHAEVLNFKDDLGTSVRKSLDQILSASQRAKQLVRQILAFSRHGKQEKILISLKPIVKETLEFLRASLPAFIELRHYLEPDAGTIMADPTQMQQVLMNLCVNAAHAMEKDGGVLQIKLANTAVSEEDTRFDPEVEPGDFVKLTVSDTGHGMDPSVLERIFDPYFTTKERGKGTGLGLAVVHGIVKSHGGTIKVDSEVGKGTTFTIFLPRAKGFEKVADTLLQPLARGTEKILFVDDESALADLGQQLLGELGYQIETRTSPIEALEAFRANPQKFDLVITDLAMPQMTGLNLARKIMGIRPGMPIILCTGFSEKANEQTASSMGIRAFLLKPLVLRDIAAAVRKALDSKNA